jgi:hypothetical protein
METVYIETTVVSYLVSRPGQDLVVAAHQQVTREWWQRRRRLFACFISDAVLDEASEGDPEQSALRLQALDGIQNWLQRLKENVWPPRFSLARCLQKQLEMRHTWRSQPSAR